MNSSAVAVNRNSAPVLFPVDWREVFSTVERLSHPFDKLKHHQPAGEAQRQISTKLHDVFSIEMFYLDLPLGAVLKRRLKSSTELEDNKETL